MAKQNKNKFDLAKVKEVEDNTIFVTNVGSRLYGIHHEESDYDKAGVMMPTLKNLILSGMDGFEQYKYPDEDFTVFDIRKTFKLLLDNSPNMFDLLYAPDSAIIKSTPIWDEVMANRDLFVSRKCRYTFSGYAIAQLRRIKTHRKFLLDPPTARPERSDFGLGDTPVFPSAKLKGILSSVLEIVEEDRKSDFLGKLDKVYKDYVSPLLGEYIKEEERALATEWLVAGVKAQANTLLHVPSFIKDEHLEMAHNEIGYYQAKKDWDQFSAWKKSRNKKRATLEEKFGYDTKHACHLVRLLRCGYELLDTGKLSVDRRGIDADELVNIRNGGWSFDKVEEYCTEMEVKLADAYETSPLPRTSNHSAAFSLCNKLVEDYLKIKF